MNRKMKGDITAMKRRLKSYQTEMGKTRDKLRDLEAEASDLADHIEAAMDDLHLAIQHLSEVS